MDVMRRQGSAARLLLVVVLAVAVAVVGWACTSRLLRGPEPDRPEPLPVGTATVSEELRAATTGILAGAPRPDGSPLPCEDDLGRGGAGSRQRVEVDLGTHRLSDAEIDEMAARLRSRGWIVRPGDGPDQVGFWADRDGYRLTAHRRTDEPELGAVYGSTPCLGP